AITEEIGTESSIELISYAMNMADERKACPAHDISPNPAPPGARAQTTPDRLRRRLSAERRTLGHPGSFDASGCSRCPACLPLGRKAT
ncbi:hypothetical protein PV350_41400, partial [Streptomyces sp. PA03-6a]|nr:hypothetical protein [Streptomyces sp. PA03-6a]